MSRSNQDFVVKCFIENPVLKEFHSLNQFWQDKKYWANYIADETLKVFHPTSANPLYLEIKDIHRKATMHSTPNLCRKASQIVVGGENAVFFAKERIFLRFFIINDFLVRSHL